MDADNYNLLLEMRQATRRHHNIANALILSKLVVVLTDPQLYGRALSAFLPVYSKLEDLLAEHKHVPALATVTDVTSTIPPRAVAMQQVLRGIHGSCVVQCLLDFRWCNAIVNAVIRHRGNARSGIT